MELRSLFVLYIDYCDNKSSQKRVQSSVPDIVSFIQGTGFCIGYRSSVAKMYQKLDECFIQCSTGFVAQKMKYLDPVNVDTRRGRALRRCLYYGKSPNKVWHLDSYDKFKPFGFVSKGCVDGGSRCILWLNILRSSKDPKKVCNIFVNYLAVTNRVPQKVALIVRRRTFL